MDFKIPRAQFRGRLHSRDLESNAVNAQRHGRLARKIGGPDLAGFLLQLLQVRTGQERHRIQQIRGRLIVEPRGQVHLLPSEFSRALPVPQAIMTGFHHGPAEKSSQHPLVWRGFR